jgi:hypothetical protein
LAPVLALAVLLYYPFEIAAKDFAWPGPPEVAARFQPGDIIYHVNPSTLYQWHAALDGGAGYPQYVAPPFAGDRGQLSPATVGALGIPQGNLDMLAWQRAWLVWSGGVNTSAAEDAYVQQVLARYPHQQVASLTNSSLADLAVGGVWLLQR